MSLICCIDYVYSHGIESLSGVLRIGIDSVESLTCPTASLLYGCNMMLQCCGVYHTVKLYT